MKYYVIYEAAIYAAEEDVALDWSDFFSRVLPQPGGGSCIHNEDYPELVFNVGAPAETRAASLRALGWPEGRLPGRQALLAHMLDRVEYEYAEYLYFKHKYKGGDSMSDSDSDGGDAGMSVGDSSDLFDDADLGDDDETDLAAGFCSAEPDA